jgi:hypothetical protein
MASKRYRERTDVEQKFVRQELITGWIAVAGRLLALILAMILGVISVLHASEWPVAVGSGGAGALLAALAVVVHR